MVQLRSQRFSKSSARRSSSSCSIWSALSADGVGDQPAHPFQFLVEFVGGHAQHTAAEGGKLDETIGGHNADGIILSHFVGEPFDIKVAGFVFPGVDHMTVVIVGALAASFLHTVGIEDENQLTA